MKITHHIPQEQFGYTEIEYEIGSEKEIVLDAIQSYHALKGAKQAQDSEYASTVEGLPHLEWNKVLDGYLTVGTMPSEVYEKMSKVQQGVIQEIKKHFKRVNKND